MRFDANSTPKPWAGVDYSNVKDIVQPDQGMSLQEILERFTRGEPLDIGHDVQYGEPEDISYVNPLHVDLEKMAHADLTEKEAFREELRRVASIYEDQQKEREKLVKEREALAAEKARKQAILREARKLAKENAAKLA